MLCQFPGLLSCGSPLQVPGLRGCPVGHRGAGQPRQPAQGAAAGPEAADRERGQWVQQRAATAPCLKTARTSTLWLLQSLLK